MNQFEAIELFVFAVCVIAALCVTVRVFFR
jgi:hypothetical protein